MEVHLHEQKRQFLSCVLQVEKSVQFSIKVILNVVVVFDECRHGPQAVLCHQLGCFLLTLTNGNKAFLKLYGFRSGFFPLLWQNSEPKKPSSPHQRIQGGPGGPSRPLPTRFFKTMQLSGNFKGKHLFLANFGLRAPSGVKTPLGPPDQNPGSAPALTPTKWCPLKSFIKICKITSRAPMTGNMNSVEKQFHSFAFRLIIWEMRVDLYWRIDERGIVVFGIFPWALFFTGNSVRGQNFCFSLSEKRRKLFSAFSNQMYIQLLVNWTSDPTLREDRPERWEHQWANETVYVPRLLSRAWVTEQESDGDVSSGSSLQAKFTLWAQLYVKTENFLLFLLDNTCVF